MLATTSILIKTEDGRQALAARRHDMQVRQRHLLILINGARTVGQLHQLLNDWPDVDDLISGLQQAGMVDVLPDTSPQDGPITGPFDPVTYFNRPLLDDEAGEARAAESAINTEPLPQTGMPHGLPTEAAPADVPAVNAPALVLPEPPPTARAPVGPELADVLPNVIKVELMRLAIHHFGSAAGAAIPLLRTCKEDTASLCDVIAACAKAAAPMVGEQTAARFVDAAMQAMARQR